MLCYTCKWENEVTKMTHWRVFDLQKVWICVVRYKEQEKFRWQILGKKFLPKTISRNFHSYQRQTGQVKNNLLNRLSRKWGEENILNVPSKSITQIDINNNITFLEESSLFKCKLDEIRNGIKFPQNMTSGENLKNISKFQRNPHFSFVLP